MKQKYLKKGEQTEDPFDFDDFPTPPPRTRRNRRRRDSDSSDSESSDSESEEEQDSLKQAKIRVEEIKKDDTVLLRAAAGNDLKFPINFLALSLSDQSSKPALRGACLYNIDHIK